MIQIAVRLHLLTHKQMCSCCKSG